MICMAGEAGEKNIERRNGSKKFKAISPTVFLLDDWRIIEFAWGGTAKK